MKFKEIFKEKGNMLRKMWINQFAFSLLGIFIASPLPSSWCVLGGIFSYLFYLFVIGYAVLDDSQKDRISYNAKRKKNVNGLTGFVYSFVAFIPTLILTVLHLIFSFIPTISDNITKVIYLINRFFLCGEVLGIDSGLANYTAGKDMQAVALGPDWAAFMSTHGIFQLLFPVVSIIIIGIIYLLGFKGIVSVNTTDTKRDK